jgi:hypothetical protein
MRGREMREMVDYPATAVDVRLVAVELGGAAAAAIVRVPGSVGVD